MAKLQSYFGTTYDSPYSDAMLAGRPLDQMVEEPAPSVPIPPPIAESAPPTAPTDTQGTPPDPAPAPSGPIIRPRDRVNQPAPMPGGPAGPPPPPPPASLPGVGGARPDVPAASAAPFRTPAFMQNRFVGGTGGERFGGAGTPLVGQSGLGISSQDEQLLAEILRRSVFGGV